MRTVIVGFIFLSLLSGCFPHIQNHDSIDGQRYVVMLSLDGFRWDYPEIYNTPVLDSIAEHGVRAEALIPCFPTKTFPNHYSIATGLYPDHHGIVNNIFYNPNVNRVYSVGDRSSVQEPRFYNGEPFWVTAAKQGIRTASYFWVGSETVIKGIQPHIWKEFDNSISFEQRIDSVIKWLQLPAEQRPALVTFYFEQPDKVGHMSGPVSPQTKIVVEKVDSLVGVFCSKKNTLSIADSIDFIIVSDHGMASVSKEKAIAINDYVPKEMVKGCYGNNPFFLIEPFDMYEDSIYSMLSELEGIFVWRKDEIPDSLNYGKNENISSLVVCAKPGWSIYADSSQFVDGGTHGYSPYYSDMHGIFYGIGSSFKNDYIHEAFVNIEVYNIVCKLLNLKAVSNDGNFSMVSDIFKE
ncbi:MAG: hypothetical protein PWQ06_1968 [Anaerophaga sp.]|nr:hypothetical protein [Anaerophaga sp.]